MKHIRYILAALMPLVLICLLCSCVIIPINKNYDDFDLDSIASVEFYDLRQSRTSYSDFLNTATPAYILPEEQKEEFFEDLSEIRFTDYIIIVLAAIDPSFYFGDWVVRVNYTDGSCDLLSNGGYNESYDPSGELSDSNHWSCDDGEWYAFIFKYIPQYIIDYEM